MDNEIYEIDIKNCINVLEKGGSILYPTDTIWGLGCDATDENAVDKISAIKNRPATKSFIVLMADVQMLRRHLANPMPDLERFIDEQQGATTIIFENIIGIAPNALAADGSLGIRIPKDDFCIALLKRYRKPILSTSANQSGALPPSIFAEIAGEIKNKVNYIVQWRQAEMKPSLPSSIIKLNADGSITKIR